jgi:hypothetical protein
MVKLSTIIICIALLIISYCIYNHLFTFFKGIRVISKIDNRYYLVKNINPEYNQKVADTLATVNLRVLKLIEYLKTTENGIHQINVDLLSNRYNPDTIMENILGVDTSFTINKGDRMEVCVDNRELEPKIEDINTLIFCILHEISHMASITYGHNLEFQKNFAFLVRKAIEIKIYEYVDYSKTPVMYCGMQINNNII